MKTTMKLAAVLAVLAGIVGTGPLRAGDDVPGVSLWARLPKVTTKLCEMVITEYSASSRVPYDNPKKKPQHTVEFEGFLRIRTDLDAVCVRERLRAVRATDGSGPSAENLVKPPKRSARPDLDYNALHGKTAKIEMDGVHLRLGHARTQI